MSIFEPNENQTVLLSVAREQSERPIHDDGRTIDWRSARACHYLQSPKEQYDQWRQMHYKGISVARYRQEPRN